MINITINSHNGQGFNANKVEAAKKLTETLQDDLDFQVWNDSHPNEDKALKRIAEDMGVKLADDVPDDDYPLFI